MEVWTGTCVQTQAHSWLSHALMEFHLAPAWPGLASLQPGAAWKEMANSFENQPESREVKSLENSSWSRHLCEKPLAPITCVCRPHCSQSALADFCCGHGCACLILLLHFKLLSLQVWPIGQQHQHHLGAHCRC